MKNLREKYYYKDKEFYSIIKDIILHEEFIKTKDIKHHGINRFNHSLRVSYYTYKLAKLLKFNYHEATRGAMLHDFFLDELKEEGSFKSISKHPHYALKNAKKHFKLTRREQNIILSHMFPVGLNLPKYKESWLVDIIDDACSFYERFYSTRESANKLALFLIIFFIAKLR